MRITHVFEETSKAASQIVREFNYYPIHRDIYDAYDKPSRFKIASYHAIVNDYETNNGLHAVQVGRVFKSLQYNNDIRVTGASSHFYSTVASFTDTETGEIWVIKETHCNTYMCKLN